MAEILVMARSNSNADPTKDQRGCYKRGMPVVVMEDGHSWGTQENLPNFAILFVPLISVDQVKKYTDRQVEGGIVTRRRLWQIRWLDLPPVARNKLQTNGFLIIKATAAYTGDFDFTWAQVKTFFHNLLTDLDETVELV